MVFLLALISIFNFFVIKILSWFFIDIKEITPEWLNYKPFNCSFCFSFWTNITLSILSTWLISPYLFVWISITALDAVAYIVDRYENTEKIE